MDKEVGVDVGAAVPALVVVVAVLQAAAAVKSLKSFA